MALLVERSGGVSQFGSIGAWEGVFVSVFGKSGSLTRSQRRRKEHSKAHSFQQGVQAARKRACVTYEGSSLVLDIGNRTLF